MDKKQEIIKITVAYKIGDRVYLVHDQDQKLYMVTGILVLYNGVRYCLSEGNNSNYFDEIEISTEKTYYS